MRLHSSPLCAPPLSCPSHHTHPERSPPCLRCSSNGAILAARLMTANKAKLNFQIHVVFTLVWWPIVRSQWINGKEIAPWVHWQQDLYFHMCRRERKKEREKDIFSWSFGRNIFWKQTYIPKIVVNFNCRTIVFPFSVLGCSCSDNNVACAWTKQLFLLVARFFFKTLRN